MPKFRFRPNVTVRSKIRELRAQLQERFPVVTYTVWHWLHASPQLREVIEANCHPDHVCAIERLKQPANLDDRRDEIGDKLRAMEELALEHEELIALNQPIPQPESVDTTRSDSVTPRPIPRVIVKR